MAGGFDELITYLLDEISFNGNEGVTLDQFREFVGKFYDGLGKNNDQPAAASSPENDIRLLAKVWQWITAHPDVLLGQDVEFKRLSFEKVKQLYEQEPGKAAKCKLFTSENRIWQAIAGHAPDVKALPALEFQALSIIASKREQGITQPDLAKLTGQDNRSLPKRTNALAEKGHIEKQPVIVAKFKTSHLRHIRYKKVAEEQRIVEDSSIFVGGRFEFDGLFKYLLEQLANDAVLTESDLFVHAGLASSGSDGKWERRHIRTTLDRLDAMKIIQRFRAPVENTYKWQKQRYASCVRLLREPTEEELEFVHKLGPKAMLEWRQQLETNAKKAQEESSAGGEVDKERGGRDNEEGSGDEEDDSERLPIIQNEASVHKKQKQELQYNIWSPDPPIYNVIFQAVDRAGMAGLTGSELRATSFGPCFVRPLDVVLSRLTDTWEVSQPSHLRQMAIIRDTSMTHKFLHYIYRTFDNFQKAVDQGLCEWEPVLTKFKTIDKLPKAELDAWGFANSFKQNEILKNGMASLSECSKSFKNPILTLNERDPRAIANGDGTFSLKWDCGDNTRPPTAPKANIQAAAKEHLETPKPRAPTPIPGQMMIKGLNQRAYHRQYRQLQQDRQEAKERLVYVRRYAEWLALQEAVAEFQEQVEKGQMEKVIVPGVMQPVGIPKGKQVARNKVRAKVQDIKPAPISAVASTRPGRKRKLTEKAIEGDGLNSSKRQKTTETGEDLVEPSDGVDQILSEAPNPDAADVQPNAADAAIEPVELTAAEDSDPVPIQKPTIAFMRPITSNKTRVEQLIAIHADTSRQGLHINPVGSKPEEALGKLGRKCLILRFKFEWLKQFDWFMLASPSATSADTSDVEQDVSGEVSTIPAMPAVSLMNGDLPLDQVNNALKSITDSVLPGSAEVKALKLPKAKRMRNTGLVQRVKKGGRPSKTRASLVLRFTLPSLKHSVKVQNEDEVLSDKGVPFLPDSIDHRPSLATENVQSNGMFGDAQGTERGTVSGAQDHGRESNSRAITPNKHVNDRDGSVMDEVGHAQIPISKDSQVDSEKKRTKTSQHIAEADDDIDMVDVEDITPEPTPRRDRSSAPKSIKRIDNRAKVGVSIVQGSLRFRKTQIIMEIINAMGGVFGGNNELLEPFKRLYEKKFGTVQNTDAATIHKGVKNLSDQGKLKKVAFVFEKYDKPVTKYVLLRSDIDFNSPVAQDLVNKIKETYPKTYIPPEFEYRGPAIQRPSIPRYYLKDESLQVVPSAPSEPPKPAADIPPWEAQFYARLQQMSKAREEQAAVSTQQSLPRRIIPSTSLFSSARKVAPKSLIREPFRIPEDDPYAWTNAVAQEFDKEESLTPGRAVFTTSMILIASTPWPQEQLSSFKFSMTLSGAKGRRESALHNEENDSESSDTDRVDWETFRTPVRSKRIRGRYMHKHLRRFLRPTQMFNAKSGTFGTFFKPPHWKSSYENGRHDSEAAFVERITELPDDSHFDPQDEIEEWQRDGFDISAQTLESGFVLYSMNHEHTQAPVVNNPRGRRRILPRISYPYSQPSLMQHDSASWPLRNPVDLNVYHEYSRSVLRATNYTSAYDNAAASQRGRFLPGFSGYPPSQYPSFKRQVKKAATDNSAQSKAQRHALDCDISAYDAKKLLYTAICVRTLAGGPDRTIHWAIVDHMFKDHPSYNRTNFKNRWIQLTKKVDAVQDIQEAFEDAYITAYERGEVPPIDFEQAKEYDWELIVNWAMENVDIFSDYDARLDLELLTKRYDVLHQDRDLSITTEYHKPAFTQLYRKRLFFKVSNSALLHASESSKEQEIARSWARATIASPGLVKTMPMVGAKLKSLDDTLLRSVIEQLVEDNVVTAKSVRFGPFTLSPLLDQLIPNQQWQPTDFQEALAYKLKLDEAFKSSNGYMTLSQNLTNGETLALTEMLVNQRVRTEALLPPITDDPSAKDDYLSVWGLRGAGNYESNKISKKSLFWSVNIHPTEEYVHGNPLDSLMKNHPIPGTGIADSDAPITRIPLWRGFSDNINHKIWNQLMLVLTQATSLNGGLGVASLRSILTKCLDEWEIKLAMNWLCQLGVATELAGSYIASEWWWLVVPTLYKTQTGTPDT